MQSASSAEEPGAYAQSEEPVFATNYTLAVYCESGEEETGQGF
jgi:hypothetical protein